VASPELPAELEPELKKVISLLAEKHWPFRLHATYNETIERALNVFEEVNREIPFGGTHWFFDHAETITSKSIDRIKALGGGIAIQHRMAYQGEAYIDRYGQESARHTPPIRRMLDADIPVGAGTDATRVASYNPFISLYWLVSGKTIGGAQMYSGDNRLSREEALRLWTEEAAGSPPTMERREPSSPVNSQISRFFRRTTFPYRRRRSSLSNLFSPWWAEKLFMRRKNFLRSTRRFHLQRQIGRRSTSSAVITEASAAQSRHRTRTPQVIRIGTSKMWGSLERWVATASRFSDSGGNHEGFVLIFYCGSRSRGYLRTHPGEEPGAAHCRAAWAAGYGAWRAIRSLDSHKKGRRFACRGCVSRGRTLRSPASITSSVAPA